MNPSTAALARRAAEVFRADAVAGRRASSNTVLAERLSIQFGGHLSRIVQAAETLRLIVVHRGNQSRVVAAPDGSWRTAGEITNTHWRDRPENRVRCRPKNASPEKRGSIKGAAVLARLRAEQAAPVHAPPPAPLVKPRPAMPVGISWAVDRRGCRWPMWNHRERPTQVFCEAARPDPAHPYCEAHRAVACRKVEVADAA